MNDPDLMFLRNLVHGAPMKTAKIAVRLRAIDERLIQNQRPDRRWELKPIEYYLSIAEGFGYNS